MLLPKRKLSSARLELTPLVDVVFLLLTFYMLTSTFIKDDGIPLALPTANTAEAREVETLTLTLIDDTKIQLNDEEILFEELKAALEPILTEDKSVVIRSSKDASMQTFVSVLDLIRESGATNVTIATDRK